MINNEVVIVRAVIRQGCTDILDIVENSNNLIPKSAVLHKIYIHGDIRRCSLLSRQMILTSSDRYVFEGGLRFSDLSKDGLIIDTDKETPITLHIRNQPRIVINGLECDIQPDRGCFGIAEKLILPNINKYHTTLLN